MIQRTARLALGMALALTTTLADSPTSASTREVIVHGAVHDAHGALARGTHVVVYALPADGQLADLSVGDSYTMTPVARATTNPDGTFTAHLDEGARLADLAAGDGVADFTVMAHRGRQAAAYSFSRELGRDGRLRAMALPGIETATEGNIVAGAAPAPDESRLTRNGVVLHMTPVQAPSSGSALDGGDPPGFDCRLHEEFPGRRVHVGQNFHVNGGARADFTYKRGSRTTLGTAFTVNGMWTKGGTTTRSTLVEVGYPTTRKRQKVYWDTFWDYGLFFCNGPDDRFDFWDWRPTEWRVGGARRKVKAPAAGHCTFPFVRNQRFRLVTTRASTWSNGVHVDEVIGFDLSSQTGYTEQAGLRFKFLRSGLRLCGTTGQPGADGQTPGLIVIKL